MNGRPLELLAYRFLGSMDDAQDVVQEARLRMLGLDSEPENPDAYLTRVVANLAVDRLRHLRAERRAYQGPWLPQPVVTEEDFTEKSVMTGEELGFGLLLLLERLSAAERVVFVLREALGTRFKEIGEMLGIAPDAARQRYRRARRNLAPDRYRATPSVEQKQLLERMVAMLTVGDVAGLVALLSEDALLLTDGGGRVSAAIRPVEDPSRIARVLVHLAGRADVSHLTPIFLPVNGGFALALKNGERIESCTMVDAFEGRVRRIYVVRNPQKLRGLTNAGRS